jgi:hypothetical protein
MCYSSGRKLMDKDLSSNPSNTTQTHTLTHTHTHTHTHIRSKNCKETLMSFSQKNGLIKSESEKLLRIVGKTWII